MDAFGIFLAVKLQSIGERIIYYVEIMFTFPYQHFVLLQFYTKTDIDKKQSMNHETRKGIPRCSLKSDYPYYQRLCFI